MSGYVLVTQKLLDDYKALIANYEKQLDLHKQIEKLQAKEIERLCAVEKKYHDFVELYEQYQEAVKNVEYYKGVLRILDG